MKRCAFTQQDFLQVFPKLVCLKPDSAKEIMNSVLRAGAAGSGGRALFLEELPL